MIGKQGVSGDNSLWRTGRGTGGKEAEEGEAIRSRRRFVGSGGRRGRSLR